MTTVLVTGTGAIIGYGVLRALRKARPDIRLVATDIYADAVGRHFADRFIQVPLTADPGYQDKLREILEREKVNLVIPGIEQDCHFYSDQRGLFEQALVTVCLNQKRLIDTSRDKLTTFEELSLVAPTLVIPTRTDDNFDALAADFGLPFIVKPRRSYASKGLVRVKQREDFLPLAKHMGSRLIAQPLIGSEDEEYTLAAFGDGEGACLATILLQRRLAADGSTAKATVRRDLPLDTLLAPLFSYYKPLGPTNFQFRRTPEGWKMLEINPRISSSTSIRAAFGYNEAAMAVDFFLENKRVLQPDIIEGSAVRYIEDMIVR